MPYDRVPLDRLHIEPLSRRKSFIAIEKAAMDPGTPPPAASPPLIRQITALADAIRQARQRGASVMLAYGAHLVKNGCGPLANGLIAEGWLTHVATQGAGIIHDLEFSIHGRSSESVRDNAPVGRFGTWHEPGFHINLAALAGSAEGVGLGEAMGRALVEGGWTLPTAQELRGLICDQPNHPLTAARADLLRAIEEFGLPTAPQRIAVEAPWAKYCILPTAFRHRVPMTVHAGIGYDIFNCHPMFHGAALGRASGADFMVFANSVKNLTGGVYLSVGSAIMSPQVFEKALSVANNLLEQEGKPFISGHTTAVVDIQDSAGWDWSSGEPPQDHPAYYLRWCKTFERLSGSFHYLQADNRLVLANLLAALRA